MKTSRAVVSRIAILMSLLFIVGCSQVSDPASTETPTPTLTSIPINIPKFTFAPNATAAPSASARPSVTAVASPDNKGVLLQKAYAISDKVTQEAQGLLAVTYAEIPDHGQGRFGVHYNVFIIKRADLLTDSDIDKVTELVAEILELTTKDILANEPSITHMGIMLVAPDFWFYGGHKRGPIIMFEASRTTLLALDPNAVASDWIKASQVISYDSDDFQP